jgi:hypothetical protein
MFDGTIRVIDFKESVSYALIVLLLIHRAYRFWFGLHDLNEQVDIIVVFDPFLIELHFVEILKPSSFIRYFSDFSPSNLHRSNAETLVHGVSRLSYQEIVAVKLV